MFSGWRHAVETLSQHSPKQSQDSTRESRSSLDGRQPADPALNNLRKSLTSQRPGSPARGNSGNGGRRVTLEDRLKAKFTIGEASATNSPNPSTKPSRSTTPVSDHPLSPSPPADSAAPSATTVETTPSPGPEPQPEGEKDDLYSPASTPLPPSPNLLPLMDSKLPLELISPLPLSPQSDAGSFPFDSQKSSKLVMDITSEVNSEIETPQLLSNADSKAGEAPLPSETQSRGEVEEVSEPALPESSEDEVVDSEPNDPVQPLSPTKDDSKEPEPTLDSPPSQEPLPPSLVEPVPDAVTPPTLVEPGPEKSGSTPESETLGVPEGKELCEESPQPDVTHSAVEPEGDVVCQTEALPSPFSEDPPVTPSKLPEPDIEGLQKRLKLVEQRFADVSTSFKRLQQEKTAADRILKEYTPLETWQDTDAMRDYFQNMNLKIEMSQDEIKRLTGKLTRQEERIEELRDIHKLESKSQSDQIEKLRSQIDESEALLKASQSSSSQTEEELSKRQAEIERLRTEVEKAKSTSKDEEEKRAKAIALLKTVRQKLVKAEKERDDTVKEVQALRDKDREEREKESMDKARLLSEIDKINAERDIAIAGLKSQLDKEILNLRDRHDKELSAMKGQFELEAVTTKAANMKEMDTKNSRISILERSVQSLTNEKNDLFDQLQLRQAELESSQSHQESLESQTTELQFQVREAMDRIALLNDELSDARRDQELKLQGSGPSPEEVTRIISASEAKYEARISDLRRQLTAAERERDEGETEWSRKLSAKVREIEALKGLVSASTKSREEEEGNINSLKEEIEKLCDEIRKNQNVISDMRAHANKLAEAEHNSQAMIAETNARLEALQQQIEEGRGREAQLKMNNKTLREELRKVQASATLLERQRNPGVGYWAARSESTTDLRSPRSSMSEVPSPSGSPNPNSPPATPKSDEEINYEYLRNVILQFLEHKEMRPHLIRILSTILRFTPQETRRLISKV